MLQSIPEQDKEIARQPDMFVHEGAEDMDFSYDNEQFALNFESEQSNLIEGTTINPTNEPQVRRSKRTWKPTQKTLESAEQELIALPMEMEVLKSEYCFENDVEDSHPLAFVASKSDPDTMYYHQAMHEADAQAFKEAMQKEIDDHQNNKHWIFYERAKVPPNNKVLGSVWSMKSNVG